MKILPNIQRYPQVGFKFMVNCIVPFQSNIIEYDKIKQTIKLKHPDYYGPSGYITEMDVEKGYELIDKKYWTKL